MYALPPFIFLASFLKWGIHSCFLWKKLLDLWKSLFVPRQNGGEVISSGYVVANFSMWVPVLWFNGAALDCVIWCHVPLPSVMPWPCQSNDSHTLLPNKQPYTQENPWNSQSLEDGEWLLCLFHCQIWIGHLFIDCGWQTQVRSVETDGD